MKARVVGALFVLALLGMAVSSAVLFDVDEPRSPRAATTPTPTGDPTPTPSTSDREITRRLVSAYPRACLRPVARPESFGLVAAYHRGAVRIVDTDGNVRTTIRTPGIGPPVAWSPSGTVLAVGRQGLFWRTNGEPIHIGDVQHGMVQGSRGEWGWSPLSDCGVEIEGDGALYVTAVNPFVAGAGQPLVDRGVESFSYSPDGRKLGLVVIEDGARTIWIADLVKNRMHLVRDFQRPLCCISLGGWTPSGSELLYWAGSGNSVMADGWPMGSVDVDGRRMQWATTVPSGPLERCGDELVGLVDGDRFEDGARLAILRPGASDSRVTQRADLVSTFSCSPDNNFFVVQSDARLALLDRNGSLRRHLTDIDTPNGRWSESFPEWGPPRTGILFVRSMHLVAGLWFVPEGSANEHPVTGLELTGRWGTRSLFDWSATPPRGSASG